MTYTIFGMYIMWQTFQREKEVTGIIWVYQHVTACSSRSGSSRVSFRMFLQKSCSISRKCCMEWTLHGVNTIHKVDGQSCRTGPGKRVRRERRLRASTTTHMPSFTEIPRELYDAGRSHSPPCCVRPQGYHSWPPMGCQYAYHEHNSWSWSAPSLYLHGTCWRCIDGDMLYQLHSPHSASSVKFNRSL